MKDCMALIVRVVVLTPVSWPNSQHGPNHLLVYNWIASFLHHYCVVSVLVHILAAVHHPGGCHTYYVKCFGCLYRALYKCNELLTDGSVVRNQQPGRPRSSLGTTGSWKVADKPSTPIELSWSWSPALSSGHPYLSGSLLVPQHLHPGQVPGHFFLWRPKKVHLWTSTTVPSKAGMANQSIT